MRPRRKHVLCAYKVGAELLAFKSKDDMLQEIADFRPYDMATSQRREAASSASAAAESAKRARVEAAAARPKSWEFGWSVEDDIAIAECSGVDYSEETIKRELPLHLLTQDQLPACKDMYTDHPNKTFLSGLITWECL